jgi:hypothetical protein
MLENHKVLHSGYPVFQVGFRLGPKYEPGGSNFYIAKLAEIYCVRVYSERKPSVELTLFFLRKPFTSKEFDNGILYSVLKDFWTSSTAI